MHRSRSLTSRSLVCLLQLLSILLWSIMQVLYVLLAFVTYILRNRRFGGKAHGLIPVLQAQSRARLARDCGILPHI